MDGVLLMAGVLASLIVIIHLLVTDEGGTKGITDEYTTKSGIKHTAKKSREQHLV